MVFVNLVLDSVDIDEAVQMAESVDELMDYAVEMKERREDYDSFENFVENEEEFITEAMSHTSTNYLLNRYIEGNSQLKNSYDVADWT